MAGNGRIKGACPQPGPSVRSVATVDMRSASATRGMQVVQLPPDGENSLAIRDVGERIAIKARKSQLR